MPDLIPSFTQVVVDSERGYSIVEVDDERGAVERCVTAFEPAELWLAANYTTRGARNFDLFKHFPGLFLQFGGLDRSEAAILDFASRFGRLGVLDRTRLCNVADGDGHQRRVIAEPVSFWQAAIDRMKLAIAAWQVCTGDTRATSEDLVRWAEMLKLEKNALKKWADRDGPAGAAARVVSSVTSETLQKLCPLSLAIVAPLVSRPVQADDYIPSPPGWADPVSVSVHDFSRPPVDKSTGIVSPWFALEARPHGLLGGLWVQFAIEVSGGSRFGSCNECGTPFIHKAKGREQRFCSSKCRASSFRRSKSERGN